jgi:diguanylate cyclase (GGDEF)-like protein
MRLTNDMGAPPLVASHRRLGRGWIASLTAGTIALVFWLDRSTNLAGIQHLYYVPIVFAAIAVGRAGGLSAAAAAVVFYHLANPHVVTLRYEEADLLQIAVFLAVGVVSARLAEDTRRLRRLAMTDDLTGLHNLRSFEMHLNTIVQDARARRMPLALMVLDVDRLKSLNDEYGHLAGAEAVRTVGRLISTCTPSDAIACRYGGDEFVVALPRCTAASALAIAHSLREAVQDHVPVLAGLPFPEGTLSISIGLNSHEFDDSTTIATSHHTNFELGESLFQGADAALYSAKKGGRNRVHLGTRSSGTAPAAST